MQKEKTNISRSDFFFVLIIFVLLLAIGVYLIIEGIQGLSYYQNLSEIEIYGPSREEFFNRIIISAYSDFFVGISSTILGILSLYYSLKTRRKKK